MSKSTSSIQSMPFYRRILEFFEALLKHLTLELKRSISLIGFND
jgi:hypothetical protein